MVTKKEVSLKKLLNIIGIFIFCGLALTNVTNPLPSNELTKEFLLFIGGCAIIYYILVSIYFIGELWRKVFYSSLILLSCFSLFMVFYLATNSIPH
ncbi:YfhO family protein [Priestia megaterium]|nr:YfhO family protein [Priestia megaterium]